MFLPHQPNFLRPVLGGDGLPISELSADDVLLLGLAQLRELRRHWRERVSSAHRMSSSEAQLLTSSLVHPGAVDVVARRVGVDPQTVERVLNLFLEDLTHG